MLEASFLDLSGRRAEDGAVVVWPAWAVREQGGATFWFHVRLGFADGARVDALAVVSGGSVSIEDVQAQPALSLADLTALADWIEGPLFEACGMEVASREDLGASGLDGGGDLTEALDDDADVQDLCGIGGIDGADDPGEIGEAVGSRRARPAWPRGLEGRRLVAQEYRAAQEEGLDPVLAVMRATGHSRRRSLRLIAQARDAGLLAPRHARR